MGSVGLANNFFVCVASTLSRLKNGAKIRGAHRYSKRDATTDPLATDQGTLLDQGWLVKMGGFFVRKRAVQGTDPNPTIGAELK